MPVRRCCLDGNSETKQKAYHGTPHQRRSVRGECEALAGGGRLELDPDAQDPPAVCHSYPITVLLNDQGSKAGFGNRPESCLKLRLPANLLVPPPEATEAPDEQDNDSDAAKGSWVRRYLFCVLRPFIIPQVGWIVNLLN